MTFRFYGTEQAVTEWAELLKKEVQAQVTNRPTELKGRYTITVKLTDRQANALMPFWRGQVGNRKWNESIAFLNVR